MKNDALKKHHFWILLGLVPLLVMIGVLMVMSGVGGAITEKQGKIAAAQSQIGTKLNPKPESLIKDADKLVEVVSKKQGELHKVNWERQKHLYTWPTNSKLLKEIERKELRFGAPLPIDRGEFEEFRARSSDVYLPEFSSLKKDGSGAPGTGMADRVAPTQFLGGWQKVIRHVNDFGPAALTNDQVWLIMEDIWVQRSLLDAVRSINEEMSAFHRAKLDAKGEVLDDPTYDEKGNKIAVRDNRTTIVPTPDDEKLKTLFRNRTWAVELELVKDGNAQRLTGTLTNLSERLQLMGMGNVMTLRVWFTRSAAEQPMIFKIGGEFLPGKGAMKKDKDGRDVPANVLPVVGTPDHLLPSTLTATEIVRVEQVFDVRTVPIKRIDALALGYRDSRHADKPLLPPIGMFVQKTAPPPADTGTPGGTPGGGPPGPMGGPSGVGIGGAPGGTPGGTPGATGSGGQSTKVVQGGGPLTTVIDGSKDRYIEVTGQVRRMPIGIVVVVDQAYMQDVLLAFANSPLRFQITQVAWTRFRDKLDGTGSSGSSGGTGSDIDFGRGGKVNFGGSGDPDSAPRPGGPGPGPGPVGPPPGAGMPPGTSGSSSGSSSSIASESQITSGLVELSVYGIVSLYEKFSDAPVVAPGTTPPGTTPGTPPVTPPGPGPMPPGPGPTNPSPKMRRRTRS